MKTSASRYQVQRLGFALLTVVASITFLSVVLVIIYIFIKGVSAISWDFLTGFPENGMRAGGILPAIVGTIYLTIGTAIFSVPLGIGAAVYLSEYSAENRWTRMIRIAIINLAGIPSVVYGLFGLGLFVIFLKFGTSLLAGSLTLAIMTLPVIISTAEEALRAVPQSFRTVSISLGATRWQTIRRIVLPNPCLVSDRGDPWTGGRGRLLHLVYRGGFSCCACRTPSLMPRWPYPTIFSSFRPRSRDAGRNNMEPPWC
jgi:phosphate transport system permease protein